MKSSMPVEESNSNGSNCTAKTKEITEVEKVAMRELTDPIMEKLRFLSEGSHPASAVQVMAIQIQVSSSISFACLLPSQFLFENGDLCLHRRCRRRGNQEV